MQTEATARVTPWGLGGDGQFVRGGETTVDLEVAEDAADVEPSAPATSGDGADVAFSGTNTQELGVDEGVAVLLVQVGAVGDQHRQLDAGIATVIQHLVELVNFRSSRLP